MQFYYNRGDCTITICVCLYDVEEAIAIGPNISYGLRLDRLAGSKMLLLDDFTTSATATNRNKESFH